jgi:hypothetical protein
VGPETVDQNYAQLQQQAQQTGQLIETLAGKLQAATQSGDPNAREWALDLKEIAIGIQQEQGQVNLLLQSIHAMVDNHVQQATAPAAPAQQPQGGGQGVGMGVGMVGGMGMGAMGGMGGGMLQRFLGGGFGRAMATGAAFGIGDDIINKIL